MKKISHPFHLVNSSPWPFLMGIGAINMAIAFVSYMHRFDFSGFLLGFGVINIIFVLSFWWRDVIREATFEGEHTFPVQQNLKFGVVLFIVSEVMFFFGFFWAYFHSSLAPTIQIGSVWPPFAITTLDPFSVPLLNTFILLTSGITMTIAHHAVLHGYFKIAISGFISTLFYAVVFTVEQFFEYLSAPFNINDSIYGSTFYLLTGFHGFHVIIGTVFIFVCFIRFLKHHFTSSHHVGLESAIWYWHFVDVVWLFLYIFIYVNNTSSFLFDMNTETYNIYNFQDPATPIAEAIIDLHNYIFFYLIIVLIFVVSILFDIFRQNNELYNVFSKGLIRRVSSLTFFRPKYFWVWRKSMLKFNKINQATNLEIVWTVFPSFILILIAIPSLSLLYSMDEMLYPQITFKAIGYQWYWSYEITGIVGESKFFILRAEPEYRPYLPYEELADTGLFFPDMPETVFDMYMQSVDWDNFGHRLLATDEILAVPINYHMRVLVTGADVLHSWAMPAFGIKIDAVPGRLNQGALFVKRAGVFYGQCSELCGVNHGFMPIVVYAMLYSNAQFWSVGV